MYVFDNGPLITLFNHYYPERFPTLWKKFDALRAEGKIISVREVKNEIERYAETDRLMSWAKRNTQFFPTPVHEELLFVTEIFKIKHFQNLIRKKELLKGRPVADPFIIAKAKVMGGCVVTQEKYKENSAQIPNVCDKFGIACVDLEGFMERVHWIF